MHYTLTSGPGHPGSTQSDTSTRPTAITNGNVYPARPKLFALYFLRLIAEVSAAGVLGPDACWLLTVIVSQEDTVWYRPVTYFNGPLMERAGLGSHDTLSRVRSKLVNAGWLYYRAGSKGVAGVYWVEVPEEYRERFRRLIPSADSSAPVRSEQVDAPQPCGGKEADPPHGCGDKCVPFSPNPNTPEESAPTPSAPAREKTTKEKTERKPSTGPHAEAIKVWCELWGAKYGTRYTFVGGKDGKHVSDILAAVDGDVTKFGATVTAYLAVGGKVRENRHPLAWLVSDVNKFKPAGHPATSRPKTVNSRNMNPKLYGQPTQGGPKC